VIAGVRVVIAPAAIEAEVSGEAAIGAAGIGAGAEIEGIGAEAGTGVTATRAEAAPRSG